MRVLKIAEFETLDAANWYDESQLGVGDKFLDKLQAAYRKISNKPYSHRLYELYDGPYEVQRRLLKPYSYVVIYSFQDTKPVVIAIAHTSREPLYWIERLKEI